MKLSALLVVTALNTLAVLAALVAAITEDEFADITELPIPFESNQYAVVYKQLCHGRWKSFLNRLPWVATHPKLRTYDDKQVREAICSKNAYLLRKLVECPICFSSLHAETLATTRCDHVMHQECVERSLGISNNCPICRQPLRDTSAVTDYATNEYFNRDTLLKSMLVIFEKEGWIPCRFEEFMVDRLEAHFRLVEKAIMDIANALVASQEFGILQRARNNHLLRRAVSAIPEIRNMTNVILPGGFEIPSFPIQDEIVGQPVRQPGVAQSLLDTVFSRFRVLNQLPDWLFYLAKVMRNGLDEKLRQRKPDWIRGKEWVAVLRSVSDVVFKLQDAFKEVVGYREQRLKDHCDSLLILLWFPPNTEEEFREISREFDTLEAT